MAHNHQRVLVIIGAWPGATHPYLTRLFAELKHVFPSLQLFLFEKSNREYAFQIIGKEQTNKVLSKALYRFTNMYSPLSHLHTLLLCLLHFKHAFKIIHNSIQEGLSAKQTYGQLFYHRALLGKQYDLVHINALQTAFHFKTKAWFGNAKVLVSSRGQDFDLYPTKYNQVLSYVDHVHVLGHYLKNKVLAKGVEEKKITSIAPSHNANTIPQSKYAIRTEETIHIVTAARLSWTKGYRHALQTIKLLKIQYPNIHYHVYGDGHQKKEIQYLIQLLELEKNCTLHGWVPENELQQKLQSYHIYLLLSIEEGYNNSVVLAQSLGLPCVVSDAGGLPENVSTQQTGVVVPRYNVKAAADAINSLIIDPKLYTAYSQQAIERSQSFTQKAQTQKYVQLYQQLLLS